VPIRTNRRIARLAIRCRKPQRRLPLRLAYPISQEWHTIPTEENWVRTSGSITRVNFIGGGWYAANQVHHLIHQHTDGRTGLEPFQHGFGPIPPGAVPRLPDDKAQTPCDGFGRLPVDLAHHLDPGDSPTVRSRPARGGGRMRACAHARMRAC